MRVAEVIGALAFIGLALTLAHAQPQRPQVLVIWHGYDGAVTTAGDLTRWQYTGGQMIVEYADLSADGIFRNGFDGAAQQP